MCLDKQIVVLKGENDNGQEEAIQKLKRRRLMPGAMTSSVDFQTLSLNYLEINQCNLSKQCRATATSEHRTLQVTPP